MARINRALHPNLDGAGYYHVINRTVAREFLFQEDEKEEFTRLMRKTAVFCGVEILTHVVMSNHYHILLKIPERVELSEARVLERFKAQVSAERYAVVVRELAQLRELAGEEAFAARLKRITDRMYSLSGFMHALNQAMSEWYNRKYKRVGPLWCDRFKSVLVEGEGHPLLAMAAYIDLNPVRAGMVEDPKEYRWSGYGEAVAARVEARAGLTRLMSLHGCAPDWAEVARNYRRHVFAAGVETGKGHGISREKVAETLARGGKLSLWDLLHCRIRYFTDGVAIGSRSFLEGVFVGNRGLFGPRRKDGARPMKGGEVWQGLMTLRALRRAPVA